MVGAIAGQVRSLREEIVALERSRASKERDAGKHGNDEFEGEDKATRSNDEATKSASNSEAAERKELEYWYRLFAGAAISPLPGWTIGDADMPNRLHSWETVVTTLSALGQGGLGSGPNLPHVDCEPFTVRRIAELLEYLMARIDEHSQHEGNRSDDEIGPEAGSSRGRPREPESFQESQGMQVGGRELRAQQRAAQIARYQRSSKHGRPRK